MAAANAAALQPSLDLLCHSGCRNAVLVMQCRKRSSIQELVRESDLSKGRVNAGTHQNSRDGLSEAADDRVILGDNDQATKPAGFSAYRLGIQRFDRRNMQDGDIDMVVGQRLGRL